MNVDQKQLLARSASKSRLDFSTEAEADKSIGIEGLGDLRDSEQDIGAKTESIVPVEASSVFSSDTSFLDFTFDLENLNIQEGIFGPFILEYFNISSLSSNILMFLCLHVRDCV